MRLRLTELRRIIREVLEWEDMVPEKAMFYSILDNIAQKHGEYLPVTHESFKENKDAILRDGIRKQPGSHGIYFKVGWYDAPAFIDPNRSVMVRVKIPAEYITPDYIVPDDRYGSGDEGYFEFMEENPDVVGGDVGTTFDSIPRNWIKSAL